MRKQKTETLVTYLAMGIFFLTVGCAKKPIVKEKVQLVPESEQPKQETTELEIHGKEFVAAKGLKSVYFDLDRSDVREDMRDVLAKNAEFLKANPKIEVRVDGHCDERGTTQYNLALGQRRAAAIRDYYTNLSVDPGRLGTLSWGEEKSLCHEKTEACWNTNRRAETLVRPAGNNNAHAK